MFQVKILKKFLVPSTVLSSMVVKSEGSGDGDSTNKNRRASDLPIYTGEHCRPPKKEMGCPERTGLEEAIGVVRKELWVWFDQYKGYRQKVIEVVDTGKAHTESALEYLKEESNYVPRVGAIGVSGLAGLVFGLRGGWVRRLVYTTAGSLTMAGLCYPRYTAEATKEVLFIAKKCLAIGYNFAYGVKPDGLKLPLPSELIRFDEDKPTPKPKQEKIEMNNVDQSNPADKDLYTNRR